MLINTIFRRCHQGPLVSCVGILKYSLESQVTTLNSHISIGPIICRAHFNFKPPQLLSLKLVWATLISSLGGWCRWTFYFMLHVMYGDYFFFFSLRCWPEVSTKIEGQRPQVLDPRYFHPDHPIRWAHINSFHTNFPATLIGIFSAAMSLFFCPTMKAYS